MCSSDLLAVISVPQSLRILGFVSYSPPLFFSGFTAYSVVNTIIMGGLAWHRSRRLELKRREMEQVLANVSYDARVNKAKAIEQSELVTMLTHELKTPLSIIALALGPSGQRLQMHERATRAVRNMREVINRCAQMARLEFVGLDA